MSLNTFLKKKWLRAKYGGVILRRYYGVKGAQILGAVHAPARPSKRFHVGLLDGEGSVILTVDADKSHHKPPVPAGYGFEIPVTALSAGKWPAEKRIQLKVIETGEIFPEEARKLPDEKGAKLENYLKKLSALIDRKTLVAGTHEVTRTGAPMILLEILRYFNERHGFKVVLLNTGREGALTGEFRKYCVAVIDELGDMLEDAPEETAQLLALLREKAHPVAIVNSLCSTDLVEACKDAKFEVISLVHEYPIGFSTERIQAHFGASNTVIFPCRDVRRSYEEHPDNAVLMTESAPLRKVLPQGCYMLERPRLGEEEMERLREELRAECGLDPSDRVVLSCGTIDSRKGFDWLVSLIIAYSRQSAEASRTHFLWVGRVNNHELFKLARHDLSQANVMDHFHHIGELEDTRAAFCIADLFLLCSRVDPFPSVVLEAFLHGVPVIGFDHWQGSADMIRGTRFGRVVPYLNVDATIHAIDETLQGTVVRRRVRRFGREFVRRNFQYSHYVDQLARLIIHEGSRKRGELVERGESAHYWKNETLATTAGNGPARMSAPPPVIVLGFHRSGTSFLAHWLHSVGVAMNPTGEFFGKGKGNPEGHYEDFGFLRLHSEIMLLQDGPFMRKWGGAMCPFLRHYEVGWRDSLDDARELVGGLSSLGPWGWKDPRTLLFLEMWNFLFPDAVRVLAVRHPLEILYSLVRRGTDPLVKVHPLMVFEGIAGYHKSVLKLYSENPSAYHVVSMPVDAGKLEILWSLITQRLGVKLRSLQDGCSFDTHQFHSLPVTEKIAAEFRSIFPNAALPYDVLTGIRKEPSSDTPASLSDDEKLDWLGDILRDMTNGRFRLFRELHRIRAE